MLPIHVAVATRCFQQSLKRAVHTAREVGADGVQLDAHGELSPSKLSETGRRQFLHHLQEQGLSVASLTVPARRTLYDMQDLDNRLDTLKQTMEFAFQLKAKVVTTRVGRVPAEIDSPEYHLLTEILNDLARHANRVGTTMAITPTGEPPAHLSGLLKTITEGPIGVDFDPAVFVLSGRDSIDALRELHGFVAHVQIRDALRDVDGTGVEVSVGRGEVVWDELLAMLQEARYRDWYTVARTQGDNRVGDTARAVEFLRRVVTG